MPTTLPHEAELILKRLSPRRVIDGATWMPLPGGTVNSVWRLHVPGGEPMIVRIGPSPEVVRSGPSWLRGNALACEVTALDRVRPGISCVPVPIAAGFRQPGLPWLAQTPVPGRPLAAVLPSMSARERAELWHRVGELVRQVQAVETPWFGTPDGSHVYPDWASMVRSDAEGLLDDARRYGLALAPFERLLVNIDRYAGVLSEVRTPTIVHSDLDPRHIFVERGSEGWDISGVIDWEYARYADPLSESLIVEMLARPEGDPDREPFLEGYGLNARVLADPAAWERQRIYRGIAEGWAVTDVARLERHDFIVLKRANV